MNIDILTLYPDSFRDKRPILQPECLIGIYAFYVSTDIDQTDIWPAYANSILDLQTAYGIVPLLKKCHDFLTQLFIPKNLHKVPLNQVFRPEIGIKIVPNFWSFAFLILIMLKHYNCLAIPFVLFTAIHLNII